MDRPARIPRILLALIVAGSLPIGCLPERQGVSVRNLTDESVGVSFMNAAGEEVNVLRGITVGGSAAILVIPDRDGCTFNPLVARAVSDGRIVARRDDPLCVGQTWDIVAQ